MSRLVVGYILPCHALAVLQILEQARYNIICYIGRRINSYLACIGCASCDKFLSPVAQEISYDAEISLGTVVGKDFAGVNQRYLLAVYIIPVGNHNAERNVRRIIKSVVLNLCQQVAVPEDRSVDCRS